VHEEHCLRKSVETPLIVPQEEEKKRGADRIHEHRSHGIGACPLSGPCSNDHERPPVSMKGLTPPPLLPASLQNVLKPLGRRWLRFKDTVGLPASSRSLR